MNERIYCPPDLRDKLRRLARAENRTMIDELRYLIEEREAKIAKESTSVLK